MRKLDRTPATLGEKLRALRRGQAVTLDMLVARTQIQRKYLEALECGAYDALPDPVYTRQFVRMYATVLEADVKYFLELYDEECGRCDLIRPLQTPRQRLRRYIMVPWSQMIGYILIGTAILSLFIYIAFQMINVFTAPVLQIVDPADSYIITDSPTIQIRGIVEEGGTVVVNEKTIPTNEANEFVTEITLQRGINTVTIEAIRRYSAHARTVRTIVYEESSTGGAVQ